MRLLELRLVDYRNLEAPVIVSEGCDLFFLGKNGQGKSNLLEAIGLITALRSFRTTDLKTLPSWTGNGNCGIAAHLQHEIEQECRVEIRFTPQARTVAVDGMELAGWRSFLGRFPCVPFCSQDLQLLRGAPALRRRFIDALIASVNARYFDVLRQYHAALRERNKLLKDEAADSLLSAYEKVLAPLAAEVVTLRSTVFQQLESVFNAAYLGLTGVDELPRLRYQPDHATTSDQEWLELYGKNRARERILGATRHGPHRDDFDLMLFGKSGSDFASDGQQRALVLALRMAQALWTQQQTGIDPIILADDILGELDPRRREQFWTYLPSNWQVCASGTEPLPPANQRRWKMWHIHQGKVQSG